MSRKEYTEYEILEMLKDRLKSIEKLYQSGCVNYSGRTKDTNILYTEIIAKKLSKGDYLSDKNIETITRRRSYNIERKIYSINNTNRYEEILAKQVYEKFKSIGSLGEVINYQVPLRNSNNDSGVGKIDLVSFDAVKNIPYLIELKLSSKDTLLKCALEICTYYCQLNKVKFIKDFKEDFGLSSLTDEDIEIVVKNIKKVVLVDESSRAAKEYGELEGGERQSLKELMGQLGVEVHIYSVTAIFKDFEIKSKEQ